MASSVEIDEVAEQHARAPVRHGVLVRFLVCLVALPLCLYLLPVALIRLPGYIYWAGSRLSPTLDYSFTTAGQNPDVVIFGDSSALHGIAPLQMSEALGLKVIDLPNTGSSLPVVDDLPLRYEMSVNSPPRLIVFYFTPWELDYMHHETPHLFEGEEMLLRHGSLGEIVAFVSKHPILSAEFPLQVYANGPKAALLAALHHDQRSTLVASNRGYIESPDVSAGGLRELSNLASTCKLPPDVLDQNGQLSVRSLISKYKSPKTKVLVFMAPIPDCKHASDVAGRQYSGVSAAAPRVMPATLFRDDGFYIHLDASAVPEATAALTASVQQALAQPPR